MKQYTAVYNQLVLELPFKLNRLTDLKIEQTMNAHGVAYLTGLLEEKQLEVVHQLSSDTNIKIKVREEGEERILFSGVPTDVHIKRLSEAIEINLVIQSYSIYLDFKLISRSFQNKDNSYENIFKHIIKDYQGEIIDYATAGKLQGSPVIQYEETDWEFLKRMASHVGAKVYPSVQGTKPQLYIGLNKGTVYEENNYDYKIQKNIGDYLAFKQNYGDIQEVDFVTYDIESMAHYELGERLIYQGTVYVITQKKSAFQKGLMLHRYILQKETGVVQHKLHHTKAQGLSIEGKVLAVKEDKIKVHLSIDQQQKEGEAYWYPFDTSYTSEGQTGWYCMPEVGTSVHLYLPKQNETEAYVRGINRVDGGQNPKTQDPTIKYFGTIDGKEMKLAPQELTFSTIEEKLHMKLTHGGGVEITSPENIRLYTGKDFYSESATVEVKSQDKIVLSTRQTNIIVDNIVHIRG